MRIALMYINYYLILTVKNTGIDRIVVCSPVTHNNYTVVIIYHYQVEVTIDSRVTRVPAGGGGG